MSTHVKYGLMSMGGWILFTLVCYASYPLLTGKDIIQLFDDGTGGVAFAALNVVWALIWYGIGQHYRKDYIAKRKVYCAQYPLLAPAEIDKAFRDHYFSRMARMLSGLFFVAVPFYAALYIRGDVTVRNCAVMAVLMLLSVLSLLYYKRHRPVC